MTSTSQEPSNGAPLPASVPGRVALHVLLTALVSVVAFCLFLFLLVGVKEDRQPITHMDHRILAWMGRHHTPALTQLAKFLADMGESLTMGGVALTGALIGLEVRKVRGAAWTLPVAVIGGGLLIQCVKLTLHRARPEVFVPLLKETGYSFPSGHSLISIVVYGLLGYFAIHFFHNRVARVAIGLATVLLIVAIGVSRVYVGVHYPSDVLAGWSLGLPWFAGCLVLHERLVRRFSDLGEPVLPNATTANAAPALS